jgi:hypothetical protein
MKFISNILFLNVLLSNSLIIGLSVFALRMNYKIVCWIMQLAILKLKLVKRFLSETRGLLVLPSLIICTVKNINFQEQSTGPAALPPLGATYMFSIVSGPKPNQMGKGSHTIFFKL